MGVVRASRLSVVARGWLEMKGLEHLLPDPHSHEDIRGCIATYYPGGDKAFAEDVGHLLADDVQRVADPTPPPPRPRRDRQRTSGNPAQRRFMVTPKERESIELVESIAALTDAQAKVIDDYLDEQIAEASMPGSWRRFDQETVEQILGRAA